MDTLPLLIVTALYIWQAINFGLSNWPGCLIFTGYAIANVGMLYLTRRL
ncbi:MAG TPA: hypothetical protein VMU02_05780 [bacterium]|nr:hypothetical protein [bacterium]